MNLEQQKIRWDEFGVEAGQFEAFRQIVNTLRSENGCPWDREQTFESLKPCMINEMTEAIAAINLYKEEKDAENLCEELGDVLLQVVLLAQIAQEEGLFQIEDVIRGISRKMIRRHPHVFHDPQMEAALKQLQEQENQVKHAQGSDLMEKIEPDRSKAAEEQASVDQNTAQAEEGEKTAAEIPGLWEQIKRAERMKQPKKDKQKEKAAFAKAADEVIVHLEQKQAQS